jgi:hypothetical protein
MILVVFTNNFILIVRYAFPWRPILSIVHFVEKSSQLRWLRFQFFLKKRRKKERKSTNTLRFIQYQCR